MTRYIYWTELHPDANVPSDKFSRINIDTNIIERLIVQKGSETKNHKRSSIKEANVIDKDLNFVSFAFDSVNQKIFLSGRGGSDGIYACDYDGKNFTQILSLDPNDDPRGVAIDGRNLYFISTYANATDPKAAKNSTLHKIDLDKLFKDNADLKTTKERKDIETTYPLDKAIGRPHQIAIDGNRLYFANRGSKFTDISVQDKDGELDYIDLKTLDATKANQTNKLSIKKKQGETEVDIVLSNPTGIFITQPELCKHIYFTESTENKIYRGVLDDIRGVYLVEEVVTGTNTPQCLTIIDNDLYWTDSGTKTVFGADNKPVNGWGLLDGEVRYANLQTYKKGTPITEEAVYSLVTGPLATAIGIGYLDVPAASLTLSSPKDSGGLEPKIKAPITIKADGENGCAEIVVHNYGKVVYEK